MAMTDTLAGSSTDAAASARRRTGVVRDPSVDAIRIVLLVAVFMLHAMMCGVSMGAGGPVLENALEEQAWFGPVSWICLLYTSPSPRDLSTSRMPSSA